MIVTDTSVVVALISTAADRHENVAAWYSQQGGPLVTTPLALAEIDYLLTKRTSPATVRAFYEQIDRGGLAATWWPDAVETTVKVARRRDDIGLTDASLVALAAHLGTTQIATLDQRHFRTLKPLTGEDAFTLLPADAD